MTDKLTDMSNLPDSEEQLSARKSMMLRTAKVVCQTGEYVCLIRDISEGAISLSFLHEAPREDRIILQLTNGHTYPILRIWSVKRQAGYNFSSDVALAHFFRIESGFEHRPIRLNIAAQGRITDGRALSHVQLLDISCGGAKLESETTLPVDRLISFDALGLPQRLGQVRWQSEHRYGLQFQHPLSIRELATMALRSQPYDMQVRRVESDQSSRIRVA